MQDFSLARRTMVDNQLRPQGVTDRGVLAAMGKLERERFVPEAARALAYFDRSVRIGEGRYLMPPAALGRLLTEVQPRPGERALVVGSGTGYSAAVLGKSASTLSPLNRTKALLHKRSRPALKQLLGRSRTVGARVRPMTLSCWKARSRKFPPRLPSSLRPAAGIAGAIIDRGVARLSVGISAGGSIGWRSLADSDVETLPGFERPRAFTF